MTNNAEEVLKKVNNILETEGRSKETLNVNSPETLQKLILPGLENSKNVLQDIYFSSRNRKGFIGFLKTFIQSKLINTVINVIEKQSMKQQKFNNLVVQSLEILVKENIELKKELERLRK